MRSSVAEDVDAIRLRPGVQAALAASADDRVWAIQLELLSILDGPAFQGSARSQAFLRFVVEECLAGREDALKERTIGAAVMGKPADYDTGSDATVRVRANEVRKRLAAHYDTLAPKAGIRIELPLRSYVPKFAAVAVAAPERRREGAREPRPLALWQLAAPTFIAIFLSLVAIRVGADSDDAFSRFWDHAMAGRNQIAVVLDAGTTGLPLAVAEAAMPIERLADAFQVPVRMVGVENTIAPGAFIVRLSLTQRPLSAGTVRIGGAVFTGHPEDHWIQLSADSPDALKTAVQILTTRSEFPSM